jgi:CheY-like chemotaxis protein
MEDDQITLKISVSDTGIGITPKQQLQLFQPFQQCDGSITRNYGGTGLGLVIAQRLAYLMNGEITLTSAPGVGSTFTVHVRLAISNSKNLPENTRMLVSSEIAKESAAFQQNLDSLFSQLTILVVDDSQVNLTLAKTLLCKKGANVTAVTGALEALEIIKNQAFDLVLMDLEMPKMSGIEASKKIRATLSSKHLPIIAVTAHVMPQKRLDVLDAGMDDILTKPYLPDQLYGIIAKWSGLAYAASPPHPDEADSDANAAVYNQSNALASVANDNQAAELIVSEFLEMIPGCEAALRKASSRGDRNALFQAAHKLEGSASTSGATLIYTEAVSLKETLSKELAEPNKIEERVAALLKQTKRFKEHISSHAKSG